MVKHIEKPLKKHEKENVKNLQERVKLNEVLGMISKGFKGFSALNACKMSLLLRLKRLRCSLVELNAAHLARLRCLRRSEGHADQPEPRNNRFSLSFFSVFHLFQCFFEAPTSLRRALRSLDRIPACRGRARTYGRTSTAMQGGRLVPKLLQDLRKDHARAVTTLITHNYT